MFKCVIGLFGLPQEITVEHKVEVLLYKAGEVEPYLEPLHQYYYCMGENIISSIGNEGIFSSYGWFKIHGINGGVN